ncbi:UNVERIFIED_CONTAM: hypothetical protein Sradi_4909900 [Sesamum radiatum]|uniref:Uncharacterized protein n=1 Tax=Sesamum radiatum TaxID=300843 RepID=A0AAW2MFK3_SESRA
MEVSEVEEEDWRQPVVDYLKYGKLPNDLRWRTNTRRRATHFIYYKGTLYRRTFDEIFLCCLSDDEKVQAMEEAHSRVVVLTNWEQTTFPHKENGLLLAYYGQKLHRLCKKMSSLSIPRQFDPPTT